MSARATRFVAVTGLSGAGRRTAAHVLEDLGWYVVDNLPPTLLPDLLQTVREAGFDKLAVVLDVRTRSEFDEIPRAFEQLNTMGIWPQILFLEASDQVIVRRQEHVRRPHPLQGDGPLLDGVAREREMLAALRAAADMVIDTSNLNVRQLSSRVAHAFNTSDDRELRLTVMSFGFKNGIPIDADMVFDVRFLPNPHWVPELRPQNGRDAAVAEYVHSRPGAADFLTQYAALVETVGAGYLREGKRFMTIAVGCTGGKHRSVAMAEARSAGLAERGYDARAEHRDLGRE